MTTNTICFINQKGGCGKSSSCFHLGGQFASMGLRVLLIDADPQGSLSQGFFGSAAIEGLSPRESLATLFEDDHVDPTSIVVPTRFEKLSLVRSNVHLARHNIPEPERTGMRQFALASFLEGLSGFDLVLIDCPPNLYLCSWNAMLAANFVVVPVPPEDFATQGLRTVHQALEEARLLQPSLSILGHLVIRYDGRLLVHRAYEQHLRQLYGAAVFSTVIPEASAFKVALSCRQPVTYYAPTSKASVLLGSLAEEMMHQMSTVNAARRTA